MAKAWTGTATRKSGLAERLAGALRPLRLLAALGLFAMLGGCAVPPAVSVATYVGDGLLLLGTGKSSTDLGISMATGQDCSTFRIFSDQDVCQDAVVARAEPIPTEVLRDDDAARAASATRPTDGAALAVAALDEAFQPLAAGERATIGAPARAGVMLAALPRPLPLQSPRATNAAPLRLAAGPPPPRPSAAIVKVAAAPSLLAVKTGVKQGASAKPKAKIASAGSKAKAAPQTKKRVLTAGKKQDRVVSKGKEGKLASAKKRKVAAKKKRGSVASVKKRAKVASAKKRAKVASAKKTKRVAAKVASALAVVPPARPSAQVQAASPGADLAPAPAPGLKAPGFEARGETNWRPFPPPPSAMGERSRWSADRMFAPIVRPALSLQVAALARP